MNRRVWFLSPLILLCSFASSFGQQLWSGIISPSRAVDWTEAGFPGGTPPDASWAQCVTAACATVTSAGSSSTAAQINAALASAPPNTYVSLPSGTYNLSGPIILSATGREHSNVVLRGQGANSTFIVFSLLAAGGGCYSAMFSMEGDCQWVNGGEENVCNWTSGYAQGSTSITLANCGSTSPALGSLSNLKVGSILILDQLDEVNDTGTIWNCLNDNPSVGNACAGNGSGGAARTNGTCNGSMCNRSMEQGVVVTGISGSNVTFSPGLYMPNWRAGQFPQAWFATNIVQNVGLENLSFDTSAVIASSFVSTVSVLTCNGCWVQGVRGIRANRSHVRFQDSVHSVLRDSYFYQNQTGGTSSYGMEIMGGWNILIENNITQQITDSDPSCTGSCQGNVMDYNFDVDNAYTASDFYIIPPFFLHASGDDFNLWEGNFGPGFSGDNIHGTHHFETVFRNTLPGWQSVCAGGACAAQTIPITLPAGDRYFNIIGNVLGEAGYHTTYMCEALTSNTFCPQSYSLGGHDLMIYWLNYVDNSYPHTYQFCSSPSCPSTQGWDVQVANYLMRWGNYDVITGGVRFCGNSSNTGWSTTCASTSEIPTTLASNSNSVPTLGDIGAGQSPMPASFYYSSKPSFFGATPFPVAGPDVTSGTLGHCSGGPYAGMAALTTAQCGSGGSLVTAWDNHSYANPAMTCYLNTMGGPANGLGSVLSFDAATCYSSANSPNPPTGLSAVVQ
jgi:hypothetical protein